MSRTKASNTERAIVGGRLFDQYSIWCKKQKEKGKPASMEHLGSLLKPKASRGSIQNYMKGKQMPSKKRLDQFVKIFGVDKNYFDTTTATHDELYRHSGTFQTKIGKEHVEFAKEINLNLDLVEALSKIVDFDESFPIYSPIKHKVKTGVYDREVNFINAPTMEKENDLDKDLQFLQVEKNGKRITLHRCDLAFLKEVQDQIVTFTEYLFHRRQKEMSEEVEKFNQDLLDQGLIEVTVDGEPVPDSEKEEYMKKYREQPMKFGSGEEFENARKEIIENKSGSKKICVTQKEIPENFVLEHDRFAKHFEKIFPDKRKATQEDWDRLFDGDVTLKDGGKATTKEGVK